MNYIYDIEVNFQKKILNFYEWNETDNIELITKAKLFKVDDKMYNLIMNNNIVFNELFIEDLGHLNICVFCNNIDGICVKIGTDGKITHYSKLTLEDEREALYSTCNIKCLKTNYKTINKKEKIDFNSLTREENNNLVELLDYVKSMKNNIECINYFYYIFYNNRKSNNKYDEIVKYIEKNPIEGTNKLTDLIECIK